MARILIGNIKGPKGDTGATGLKGATGATGPQGPLPPLIANYLATQAGQGALDAYMGKLIDQRLTDLMTKYTQLNSDLGGYKIAPMSIYFPLADTDNSLALLQKMPEKSMGYFVLTGVNSRMGLTGVAGAVTYVMYRETGTYGSITAITKSGSYTRIWDNGVLSVWEHSITSGNGLTDIVFGRETNRIYIRFIVSTTTYYQLEIYDDGPLTFSRSINGAWATMWTK